MSFCVGIRFGLGVLLYWTRVPIVFSLKYCILIAERLVKYGYFANPIIPQSNNRKNCIMQAQGFEKIILIPTSNAKHLTKLISGSQSCQSGQIQIIDPPGNSENQEIFPDGEVYTRLPEWVKDFEGRVVVLHSGMPNPNDGLVRLLMILSILSKSKATVEVFFSYFSYGMQDHAKYDGETNMARDIITMLVNYYGVAKIYVLDPHFGGQTWIMDYPVVQVFAGPILYSAVRQDYPDVIFMAPDAGSQRRTSLPGTKKERHNSFDVEIKWGEEFPSSVEGKIVAVVDDLIETGGTLVKFHEACKECRAKETIAVSTHGVLLPGIKRVKSFFSRLYLTNSVNREESNVDISSLIVRAILTPSP